MGDPDTTRLQNPPETFPPAAACVQNSNDDVIPCPTPLQSRRPETDSDLINEQPETVSQNPATVKKSKKMPEDTAEHLSWLPPDWRVEFRMRSSGVTAGSYDRYFFSPTGKKFRSKAEVLHFLETGITKKRKAHADGTAQVNSESRKAKEAKRKKGDFSHVDLDFRNPPQNVNWTVTNASHNIWMPVGDEGFTPEHVKKSWDDAFSCITELES